MTHSSGEHPAHVGDEYQGVIGRLPTPYVLVDEKSGGIRLCNDAFLRFLGSDSLAAAEQASFFDLLDAEGRETTMHALAERKELRDEELRGQTPEGRRFTIVGTFRPSAHDGLAEGGFVDVTARKRAEQQRAAAHELETVGRFAARLGHDINNALLVVSGFAELIAAESGAPQPTQEYADEIGRAIEKAGGMVRQLHWIGRAPVESLAGIDANDALRKAELGLRQKLREGQSLVLSLEEPHAEVKIPAARLDMVLDTLVLFAREAMPAGGTVTITARTGADPSFPRDVVAVILEIRDTGAGRDETALAKIFEPFFAAGPAGDGTQVGLFIVRMIIEAAGGHIHAESSPGSGTLFRIVLPSGGIQ